MAALQRFRSPFDDMDDTVRLLVRLAGGQQGAQQQQQREGQDRIIPAAEAYEDDTSYALALEIPGVDPRNVNVSIVGNTLTVQAERRDGRSGQQGQQSQQEQAAQRNRHYLFSEIPQGTIRREFGLPEDADRNRINAEFRNGLLLLTVPKSQEAHQRRRIEVRSS